MGIALARKLRSDFGSDRHCGGDSLLFSAAVQNSDRLDATDVKRNYRSSQHRAIAKYCATDCRIRSSGSQLHQRDFARGRPDFRDRAKENSLLFTFSRLECERQNFLVYASPDTLRQDFNVFPNRLVHRGEVIARGAIDTGDQVFVDKCSYNFVKPHNGDVFVFRTNGIPAIREDPIAGPPFYIKRLAGLPGDTLRIDPPFLYINGKKAEGYGFERVMSARPPYRGYAPGHEYLSKPDLTYTVPRDGYFAMGDNSYNSFDSRYWGPVPVENLVGRGLFVYWPFFPHWGLIR